MAEIAIRAASFIVGFCLALHVVGYGVRGGLRQVVHLWRYRTGRCKCRLCA